MIGITEPGVKQDFPAVLYHQLEPRRIGRGVPLPRRHPLQGLRELGMLVRLIAHRMPGVHKGRLAAEFVDDLFDVRECKRLDEILVH